MDRRVLPLVALLAGAACGTKKPAPPPAAPVSVVLAARHDVPLTLDATGTVEPVRTVAVQAQVSGVLTRVAFREGQQVEAGQLLFEIDPRPLQAALAQAQAVLARDAAQVENARRDVQRYEALAAKEYVTQQQLEQTRASGASLAATLRADSAAVDQVRLNLQYASIRAPIAGRAGAFLVREGNLVRAGSGEPLVVINQIAPSLVRFPVPAANFDAVRRRANDGLLVTAVPLSDSAGSSPQQGKLVFLDNAVDASTGTVTLKAQFDNPRGELWPGAMVRVTLRLDVERAALVVPRAAVQTGQAGDVVWVIGADSKAKVHKVVIRRMTDSLAVIADGIAEGDRVVTDGQLRLTDGAKVAVRGKDGAK